LNQRRDRLVTIGDCQQSVGGKGNNKFAKRKMGAGNK
jgi:hypothetical protein